jgi:thiol-disulfide isomerase/thioredoxin
MKHRTVLVGALSLAVSSVVFAEGSPSASGPASGRLSIGDAAPSISVTKWVRGDSVASYEAGKVYVVEFWATWCGPCIRAMPHLQEVQAKHAKDGVRVVAVSKADQRNTLEKVEAMVKEKNAAGLMQYSVAFDGDKRTYEAFMGGAKQRGIPHVFVVDGAGRVAFIGHPMEMDAALEGVIAGTWDLGAEKARYETQYEKDSLRVSFYDAMDNNEWERASSIARAMIAGAFRDDAGTLNGVAWRYVDPDADVTKPDLEVALLAAERAAALEPESASILDTLARVYFVRKEFAKAIDTQAKAVEFARDDDERASLRAVLKAYRAAAD